MRSAHTLLLLPIGTCCRPPSTMTRPSAATRSAFAPKILEQTRVENANAFGAPEIQNLAPGIRHLFATKVVNANQFGTAQVRVSHRYLVQARVANANQFGAHECSLRSSGS